MELCAYIVIKACVFEFIWRILIYMATAEGHQRYIECQKFLRTTIGNRCLQNIIKFLNIYIQYLHLQQYERQEILTVHDKLVGCVEQIKVAQASEANVTASQRAKRNCHLFSWNVAKSICENTEIQFTGALICAASRHFAASSLAPVGA